MTYEAVIGLEVHAQLSTRRKLFCGCPTDFGAPPNTQTCPVCLGLPGALPVANEGAVDLALRLGLAVGATVHETSVFARKNYFYPDLPKAYQISQYDRPLLTGGAVPAAAGETVRDVELIRIHLEEDAGKSKHPEREGEAWSLIDLNRCGVPLAEIVTAPVLASPAEARAFLSTLRQLVQHLGVCDGNMEQGSLRCDANVSIRPPGDGALGTRTEIKNLNSIRNVEKALEAEIVRQTGVVSGGGHVRHMTLLFDQVTGGVRPMRTKEQEHDYRYFPDPDLPPLVVARDRVEAVRRSLPELPWARRARFQEALGLGFYDADVLTQSRGLADYYEASLDHLRDLGVDEAAKPVANWVQSELLRVLNERGVSPEQSPVTPGRLAGLVRLVLEGSISGKIAKQVFEEMLATGDAPEAIVEAKGWVQVQDENAIRKWVAEAFDAHPDALAKLLAGEAKTVGFFVGQVMKASKGTADPKLVQEALRRELDARRER